MCASARLCVSALCVCVCVCVRVCVYTHTLHVVVRVSCGTLISNSCPASFTAYALCGLTGSKVAAIIRVPLSNVQFTIRYGDVGICLCV